MLVPIRLTRTEKPPVGTPIDWSNPLTAGLVNAWPLSDAAGASVFDGVNGKATILQAGASFSPSGLALVAANLQYGICPTLPFTAPPFSVVSRVVVKSITATRGVWSIGNSATANNYHILKIEATTGLVTAASSTAGSVGALSSTAVVLGKSVGVAGVWTSSAQRQVFVNGVYEGQSLTSVVPVVDRANIGRNCRTLVTDYFDGTIEHLFCWKRVLRADEILALNTNPWQIYEPETIWVTVAAGNSITAVTGHAVTAGKVATIFQPHGIDGVVSRATLVGKIAAIVQPHQITAIPARISITGQVSTILTSNTIIAIAGRMGLAGKTPGIQQPHAVIAVVGAARLRGYNSAIIRATLVTPNTTRVMLAGKISTITMVPPVAPWINTGIVSITPQRGLTSKTTARSIVSITPQRGIAHN